ncbi:hypothetical protein A9200_12035 [Maribacter hydrothermalis]|uniref:Uncharacterized protein n=2 Tax=Maribacter hydrothermalis TaxID=1836467 RepID=A0A1B7YXS5_9FLAO|nr:hypothetical protein A9200_12035 [Maribacter hydrothermalis]
MGLGKFSLVPNKNINFIITAFHQRKSISVPLMSSNELGYVLTASTNHIKKEVAISIRTNEVTNNLMGPNPITLLVDAGNKTALLDIPVVLTELKKEFLLPYMKLSNGINTISLLGKNDSVLASRSIFILKEQQITPPEITAIKKENDSLTIRIKTTLTGEDNFRPSISVSVLP